MRLSLSALPPCSDGHHMFVASGQDLTEQKIQEEKFRQNQRMEALGKLTGGVAHDYNNMLGVILGYSEILQEAVQSNPSLSNYVKEIQKAGERGVELTQKLLAFSRKKQVEPKPLDLNFILEAQRLMLAKTLTARIELSMDLQADLWPVNVDAGDLQDAIVNLSINAMHAMESHGQLSIKTRNCILTENDSEPLHLSAGNYAVLDITDNGMGMDEQVKTRMFEPFFQPKEKKEQA